jgi:hypothetical protein
LKLGGARRTSAGAQHSGATLRGGVGIPRGADVAALRSHRRAGGGSDEGGEILVE